VFIVNHFGVGQPIADLRRAFPKTKILALVDPALEVVLSMTDHFNQMFHDLVIADAFGGRTKYDAQFYQAMTGVPAFWVPSPIGWYNAYDKYRKPFERRDQFLITTDHSLHPKITAQNIALGKMIYGMFGIKTKYIRAKDTTKKTAEFVGHEGIELMDWIGYEDFCAEVSKCLFGYDLYWMHSQGRNTQTFTMCKTPIIGSRTTNPFGAIAVDPFDLEAAANWALKLMLQPDVWGRTAAEGLYFTERNYGFTASRRRMENILEWMFSR
jgi:hypothetical protein